MNYKDEYNRLKQLVNDNLMGYMPEEISRSKTVLDAMKYSLGAGGKRLRPVLMIAACKMSGGKEEDALPFACALECIHTYSLIHDDLPAMDDDELRRGMPTNHMVYGEACAILAGDALLNRAFEIMLNTIRKSSPDKVMAYINAAYSVANASGYNGMVGGQIADIEGEGSNERSIELLEFIHENKTSALIQAAVLAGGYIGGASKEMLQDLDEFGRLLGLSFQIYDDILDVCGNTEELGKPVGSDDKNGKLTYPSCVGMDKAREIFERIHTEAIERIEKYGEAAEFLTNIAIELHDRIN